MTSTSSPNGEQVKPVDREEVMNRLMKFLENPNNALTRAVIGHDNEELKAGTAFIANSRVISGNANRLLMLLQLLKDKGLPSANKYINYICINSKGFSKEIPDYGMVGEAIELVTRTPKPKPEQTQLQQGIMRSNQPQQTEIQQQ